MDYSEELNKMAQHALEAQEDAEFIASLIEMTAEFSVMTTDVTPQMYGMTHVLALAIAKQDWESYRAKRQADEAISKASAVNAAG